MVQVDSIWPAERRDQRLHIRVSADLKRHIEHAARELGMSVSEFVVGAVREHADEVLAHSTTVPSNYFDDLLAALDEPPRVIPELLDALDRAERAVAAEPPVR